MLIGKPILPSLAGQARWVKVIPALLGQGGNADLKTRFDKLTVLSKVEGRNSCRNWKIYNKHQILKLVGETILESDMPAKRKQAAHPS